MTARSACLAGGDGADLVSESEELCAVLCVDLDGFERGEAGLDEEFEFAVIAEAGDGAADAGGIGPGEERAASLGKCALKFHLLLEDDGPERIFAIGDAEPIGQVVGARFGRKKIEDSLRDGGTVCDDLLEHGQGGGHGHFALHEILDHVGGGLRC